MCCCCCRWCRLRTMCIVFSGRERSQCVQCTFSQGTAGQAGRQVKSVAQVNHISNADNWPIYRALHTALSHCNVATLHCSAATSHNLHLCISFRFCFCFFFLAKYWQGLEHISMFVLAVTCHCCLSLSPSLSPTLSFSIGLLVMSDSGWACKPMLMTCKLCLNCGFAATKWHFDCPPKFISTHSAFIIFVDSFIRYSFDWVSVDPQTWLLLSLLIYELG